MRKRKHKAGRPRRGSTTSRDAIECIELELIALSIDVDEIDERLRQALRRTPLVLDVLGPALERTVQMRARVRQVKEQVDAAWDHEQRNWRAG